MSFKDSWDKAVLEGDIDQQLKLYREWPSKVNDFITQELYQKYPDDEKILQGDQNLLVIAFLRQRVRKNTSNSTVLNPDQDDCYTCDDCGSHSCRVPNFICDYCSYNYCFECRDVKECPECQMSYCTSCEEDHQEEHDNRKKSGNNSDNSSDDVSSSMEEVD